MNFVTSATDNPEDIYVELLQTDDGVRLLDVSNNKVILVLTGDGIDRIDHTVDPPPWAFEDGRRIGMHDSDALMVEVQDLAAKKYEAEHQWKTYMRKYEELLAGFKARTEEWAETERKLSIEAGRARIATEDWRSMARDLLKWLTQRVEQDIRNERGGVS